MIRRWRERRAAERERRAARARYLALLDQFISAGEDYQDAWARGYDKAQKERR